MGRKQLYQCIKRDYAREDVDVAKKEKPLREKLIDKFSGLVREFKKPWNMMVTVIPIVVDAIEKIHKGFEIFLKKWKLEEEFRPSRPHRC